VLHGARAEFADAAGPTRWLACPEGYLDGFENHASPDDEERRRSQKDDAEQDLSNVMADPIVAGAWDRITEGDRRGSYSQEALSSYRRARETWRDTYILRLSENGIDVSIKGPVASIGPYRARFEETGREMLSGLAEQFGLLALPVEFHSLFEVQSEREIPFYEADVIGLVPRWALGTQRRHVWIVGRLDIPICPRPIDRVVDTRRKAQNLANKVSSGIEARNFDIVCERIAAEDEVFAAFDDA
jgi:hypothetical protein